MCFRRRINHAKPYTPARKQNTRNPYIFHIGHTPLLGPIFPFIQPVQPKLPSSTLYVQNLGKEIRRRLHQTPILPTRAQIRHSDSYSPLLPGCAQEVGVGEGFDDPFVPDFAIVGLAPDCDG